MELTREEMLEKLLKAYSHRYDIVRDVTVEGGSFPAGAIYFLRDENYLIDKKHVLSAVENHEYVYFYLTDRLEADDLTHQIEITKQDGMGRIKPSREHMSSFVTLVVLADEISPDTCRLWDVATGKKMDKDRFRQGLGGFMEAYADVLDRLQK